MSITMNMKKRTSVALIIETSGAYGRGILRGVSRYNHIYTNWSFFLDERQSLAQPVQWLADWDGDGVICRSTTPELAHIMTQRGLPVVDCNERYGFLGLPYIASDADAIGEMATRHLIERGFERICFCGFEDEFWSEKRLRGVEKFLSASASDAPANAHLCGVFKSASDPRERNRVEERARLCQWLETLDFPVGIVACNDTRGQHVLDACRTLGIAVPEQVAVIGVDNSEVSCGLSDPPLSSVVPAAEKLGFEAAAWLDRLVKAKANSTAAEHAASVKQIYLSPIEVVTRQSSDGRAVDDPAIARALHFIRQRACDAITVKAVAAHVRLSRSTLERKFRLYLDCSPQQEIRRLRLQRVQQLLRETDLSLARIAELAGYDHPQYMMAQFKIAFGQTPSQWRAKQLAAYPKTDDDASLQVAKNLS